MPTGIQVPRKGLRVRVPCPPLSKSPAIPGQTSWKHGVFSSSDRAFVRCFDCQLAPRKVMPRRLFRPARRHAGYTSLRPSLQATSRRSPRSPTHRRIDHPRRRDDLASQRVVATGTVDSRLVHARFQSMTRSPVVSRKMTCSPSTCCSLPLSSVCNPSLSALMIHSTSSGSIELLPLTSSGSSGF